MASAKPELSARLSIASYALLSFCLLSASPTRSQSLPGFGCLSTEGESTFNSELRSGADERTYSLRPLLNPQEIAAAQGGARPILFSKIDAAKYGFARVRFFVHDTPPPADKRAAPEPQRKTPPPPDNKPPNDKR